MILVLAKKQSISVMSTLLLDHRKHLRSFARLVVSLPSSKMNKNSTNENENDNGNDNDVSMLILWDYHFWNETIKKMIAAMQQ